MSIYIIPRSKIKHLGGKAVDSKYKIEIEYSEIGTGCGQSFILIKNIMAF